MNAIVYLFQVSACMGIFYLFYYLLLSRYTFFTINRWYLIITLVISFIIPLLTITVQQQEAYPQVIQQVVHINKMQVPQQVLIVNDAPKEVQFNWMLLLRWIYVVSVGALLLRLMLIIVKFLSRIKNKRKIKIGGVHIVKGDDTVTNGSFFNYIFLNDDELSADELEQIIAHEMLHVKLYHSVDRIMVKIAQVFLWFNPFIYLYARAIEENHEFEVDRAISNSTDRNKYAELLFHLSVARQGTLYHNFSMVPLKKRITMLFTKPTNRLKKVIYLLVVPVVLLSCLAFAKLKNDESNGFKKPLLVNLLADSSKKNKQKPNQDGAYAKAIAEAEKKYKIFELSAEYKTKMALASKIGNNPIVAVVEGIALTPLNKTEINGFILNYKGNKLLLYTSVGEEKQLNKLLKMGDKITVHAYSTHVTQGEIVGIRPSLVILNGKKIFHSTQQNKISNHPFKADTGKLSVIGGLERLGANPLVLIDGVEYSNDILYKISQRGIRGSSNYLPEYAVIKYGERAKDGAVVILTRNGEINYLSNTEKQNLLKLETVKGKFFSRVTLIKEDGSAYDVARIRRASGSGAGADLPTNGKIAFIINNKLYNEEQFKSLFKEDSPGYGSSIGVGRGSKELVDRGFNVDGYDLVFDFEPSAKSAAIESNKTGAVAPQIKNWQVGSSYPGKPKLITGGSSDYRGGMITGITVGGGGRSYKKAPIFSAYGMNSTSKGLGELKQNNTGGNEGNKNSDIEAKPAGRDTVGTMLDGKTLKQTMAMLPGIEVRADGSMWVNNQPVNKAQINGGVYTADKIRQVINKAREEAIEKTKTKEADALKNKADLLNSVPKLKMIYKEQNDSLVAARFAGEVTTTIDILGQKLVIIKNGDYFAAYSNLKNTNITRGQKIKAGQVLGIAGFNEDENKVAGRFELYRMQTLITNKTEQEVIIRDLTQERLNMRLKLGEVYAFKL